jgi:hypothetical protein
MTDQKSSLVLLWREQAMTASAFDPGTLEARSDNFARQVFRRNAIEYIAGTSAALFFLLFGLGVIGEPASALPGVLTRVAAFVLVGGLVVVGVALYRRASAGRFAGMADAILMFHVRELTRQRDALRGVWVWYLGPLLPGLAIFYAGVFLAPDVQPVLASLAAAGTAVLFIVIGLLNHAAANRLARQIAELEVQRQATR